MLHLYHYFCLGLGFVSICSMSSCYWRLTLSSDKTHSSILHSEPVRIAVGIPSYTCIAIAFTWPTIFLFGVLPNHLLIFFSTYSEKRAVRENGTASGYVKVIISLEWNGGKCMNRSEMSNTFIIHIYECDEIYQFRLWFALSKMGHV